jgi:hypothetical protein
MASLSSLLNPSSGTDQKRDTFATDGKTKLDIDTDNITEFNSDSQKLRINNLNLESVVIEDENESFHKPTSVSELLINRSNELEQNNSTNNNDNSSISAISNTTISQSSLSTMESTSNNTTNASVSRRSLMIPDNDNSKSYQTLLINARSRHLKKNDGEPYWRNEIQFKFLMHLFFNHNRVFRNPYYNTLHGFDWPEHFKYYKDKNGKIHSNDGEMLTFFELYLITLLKSSKISKILKARLMIDINYALNFAIICLLVNIGRLNTTVNFDFEMKSQFRTYHSIPSLQVGNHFNIIEKYYSVQQQDPEKSFDERILKQDSNDTDENDDSKSSSRRNGSGYTTSTVKQLQDTPRIKSILKSVNDLSGKTPRTYADFISAISTEYHNFNIVSVVFLICAHEYDIGQSFFPFEMNELANPKLLSTGSLLNDIWLRPKFNSNDKVKKFLWLIYTIMETGLSISKILNNPFNENFSSETYKIEENKNLVDEISIIDHKHTTSAPTIMKIKEIIPKWSVSSGMDAIDPLINDFDTAQEVEFAAQMKHMRVQFVESENHNTTITNIFHHAVGDEENRNNINKSTEISTKPENSGRSIQARNRNKKARLSSNDFFPHFYDPDNSKHFSRQKAMQSAINNYGFNSGSEEKVDNNYVASVLGNTGLNIGLDSDKRDHEYDDYDDETPTFHGNFGLRDPKSIENLITNEETDDEIISNEYDDDDDSFEEKPNNDDLVDITSNSQFLRSIKKVNKRPNDESVELSAIDPMIMSAYEDNFDDGGLIGFFNYGYPGSVIDDYRRADDDSMLLTSSVKKRKTRKTISVEPSIKNTANKLEAFLNKDNKSFNSTSKNALLKKERNRMVAEFMFELIKQKQSQAKKLRHKEGNWKHFTKHLWNPNMFVEKEQSNMQSTYQDWGEFKTTMFKTLTQVNFVINERMSLNSSMKTKETKDSNDEIIDELFAQL